MRTTTFLLALAPLAAGAQTLCDSLVIESFTYDPFGNGLHIRVRNNSTQFLGYPHFDVLDDQGVNIVQGSSGFFGILPGSDQLHVLDVGGTVPPSPFTGALVFNYTNADGEGSCTYPMDQVSLCPPDSCFPFQVYGISQSGQIDAEFVWTILGPDNVVMDNGTLEFTADGLVEVVDATCLPPGAYNLLVDCPFPTGDPFQVGVTASLFEVTPISVALPPNGFVSMPFTLFAPCFENTQGVEEATGPAAVIAVDGRLVRISASDGRALGDLIITDAMGRTIRTIRAGGNAATVDLSGAAAGTYLLRSLDVRQRTAAQRFILF